MMEIGRDTIEAVIEEALKKYEAGRIKYGPLDLGADGRNFLQEMEAELLDCINYCIFQILRLRRLRDRQVSETHVANR